MGYKRKLYRFTFAGNPDLEGLEIVARPVSVDQILSISEDLDSMAAGTADKETVLKMANLFVESMVSWTVEEDDGTPAPLPQTGKDFMAEDASLALAVMTEWQQRIFRVAPPLPDSSSDGATSALEQSIPMAPLSPSQPNSGEHDSSSASSNASAATP